MNKCMMSVTWYASCDILSRDLKLLLQTRCTLSDVSANLLNAQFLSSPCIVKMCSAMAFTITGETSTRNSRFNLQKHFIDFKLNPFPGNVEDPQQWLKDGLREIFTSIVQGLNGSGKVGFTLSAENSDIHIPFKEMAVLNFDDVWSNLYKLFQSNEGVTAGDNLKFTATWLKSPIESGLENILDEGAPDSLDERNTSSTYKKETGICSTCSRQYPHTGRNHCDRCFIKDGKNFGKWIPYNPHSWESYDSFKSWQHKYDRKKVTCSACKKQMLRTSIYRHREKCQQNYI